MTWKRMITENNYENWVVRHPGVGIGVSVALETGPSLDAVFEEIIDHLPNKAALLDENENDVKRLVLALIGEKAVHMHLSKGLGLSSISDLFGDLTGWPPLDGSFGIKLTALHGAYDRRLKMSIEKSHG